jgi:FkbM family methyltransferase
MISDLFDKGVHYIGRNFKDVKTINIGAMDGVLFDELYGYSNMYKFTGLYVEPIPYLFERLKSNLGELNTFENSAISDYNGFIDMITIDREAIDNKLVHECFYGMSAVYPPKNGLGSEFDKPTVDKYGKIVKIPCITLETLFNKHNIFNFDIFKIDAEGHDFKIINQLDLNKYKPKVIRCEWINLSDKEKNELTNKFEKYGYVYEILHSDITAISKELYELIGGSEKQTNSNSINMTLVTGLWDIGRGDLNEGWSRSFDHYLTKFKELLLTDCNMIIFGDEKLMEIVSQNRSPENTQFILRNISWFKQNNYYEKIQNIRTNQNWYNQVGWLSESTQTKLEMYNPLVMSKMFLLHDAKLLDRFNSDKLFWIDAGLTNTVHSGYFTNDGVLNKISNQLNKFNFVCFPYETNSEIHGFTFDKMCELTNDKPNIVARGGFFGGDKNLISELNVLYYNLLIETLNSGYMGTEESLFTILLYQNPEIINYYEIEGNGLLYKFFEDTKNDNLILKNKSKKVKNNNQNDTGKVGLYVITFNSPKQLETLIESILDYDPNFIAQTKKFLLNNSTDLSTTDEYVRLCEQYGFEHIKKDNIGITGGRQFIAEHFDEQEDLSYYYFFEDDMFFYNGYENVCRNGFNRKINDLFRKSLTILKNEEFDFLKLNFTEFFGSHDKQWSWYNVPQNFRESHWPNNPKLPINGLDPNSPNLEFKHIKSYDGLPYVSGEIYLSNWPILMSKTGNYNCYIKTKFAHPYEQTLMSNCYQETIKGNVKPGLLLATPTEHNRFDFYDGNLRKEC